MMKPVPQICAFALLGSGLFVTTALAQTAPNQAAPQQQSPAANPYTGISNPPPDDTILSDEATPQNPAAPIAKPSPAIAAQPAAVAQPQFAAPASAGGLVHAASAYSAVAGADYDTDGRWDGTDYGIVAPAKQQDAGAEDGAAGLKRRYDPDSDIVSYVPLTPNALNQGTNIEVRLLEDLSSRDTREGSNFRATVIRNVYRQDQLIIPAGAELRGRVTDAHPGHRLGERATLRLTPEAILLPDGTSYHLTAQVVYTAAPHTRTTNEGNVQPSLHLGKDAAEYGVGVGAGVLAGSQFGPQGALVGTVVGAGVITAHLLVQPPSAVELPKNADVVFSLTQPMQLTPTRN